MLDSTLGLLIIWAGIRLAQHCARAYDIPLINFGEYGKCSTVFFIRIKKRNLVIVFHEHSSLQAEPYVNDFKVDDGYA